MQATLNHTTARQRTIGQKLGRLVLNVTKFAAGVGLTVMLLAMFGQIVVAFMALIGIGWFVKNSADIMIGTVKGIVYTTGKAFAALWRNL